MQNMTAPQLLKLAVLTEAARLAKTSLPEITAGNIDKVYPKKPKNLVLQGEDVRRQFHA